MVTLPLAPGNQVCCPFHDDVLPSCAIYADSFHCFGCGERGGRLDWLTRAEGMTEAEAIAAIKDWSGPSGERPRTATPPPTSSASLYRFGGRRPLERAR